MAIGANGKFSDQNRYHFSEIIQSRQFYYKILCMSSNIYMSELKMCKPSLCDLQNRCWTKFLTLNGTMNRKYKDKHRFVGVFERRNPKLLILDPELVSDIYVKHFNHFQVNDSSSAVSYFIKQTFRCFISFRGIQNQF